MDASQVHPPDALPGEHLRQGAGAVLSRGQPPHHLLRRRRGPQHDLPFFEAVRARPAHPGGRAQAVPGTPTQGKVQ